MERLRYDLRCLWSEGARSRRRQQKEEIKRAAQLGYSSVAEMDIARRERAARLEAFKGLRSGKQSSEGPFERDTTWMF